MENFKANYSCLFRAPMVPNTDMTFGEYLEGSTETVISTSAKNESTKQDKTEDKDDNKK